MTNHELVIVDSVLTIVGMLFFSVAVYRLRKVKVKLEDQRVSDD